MGKFATKDRGIDEKYLTMVESDISSKKEISFLNGNKGKIKLTKNIKTFLKGIGDGDQKKIDSVLLDGKKLADIFETTNGDIFSWNDIDKSQYSGMGGKSKSDGKSTAMQERASMYAIEQGLNKNGYKDKKTFLKDCKKELKKLYPDMDAAWEETFFQQQITVADKIPKNNNFHYSRDDGFMEKITNLVKDQGISQKDSWNPADIWLVESPNKQIETLARAATIEEINDVLRSKFIKNTIVGISLKKMSGKTAQWELVNIEKTMFAKLPNYKLGSVRCKLDVDKKGNVSSTDSVVEVLNGTTVAGTFQIRQNSKGFNNLKVEASIKGAGAARAGKVPLDMLATLMSDYKSTLNNKHQNFPKNAADFKKRTGEFKKYWKKIKDSCDTNIKDKEFESNILAMYKKSPDIAMSKLMQLDFLNQLFCLPDSGKKRRDYFVKSMYFLAQKKGNIFGPFGKLY
jgi:hypothetical protein